MHRCFGSLDRERIHHLHGRWNDAGRDDLGHRRSRSADAFECGKQRPDALRLAQDSHNDARDDRERPLRTDDQTDEIGAGCI